MSRSGLPIGVQIVGRQAEDALVLSLAAQLERAAPWASRRAPI
jgi:amidase